MMIPNNAFDAIEIIDPEAQVSQPEPIQAVEINPETPNEQLSITEGFFNAPTERKPATTRPIYLLMEHCGKYKCICDRAHRPENIRPSNAQETSIEEREVVWCEAFETNPEDWEDTEGFELYQRSHGAGYPAVDIGDPWRPSNPEPWLAVIAELKAQGLPLIYARNSTAWAEDLEVLQNAGYTFGKITTIQDISCGGCRTEKAIEILY